MLASSHSDLFNATIAGLGLTGLILWARIQLKRISSAAIEMQSIKFGSLDEFLRDLRNSESSFEYTVAWLDCVTGGQILAAEFLCAEITPRNRRRC